MTYTPGATAHDPRPAPGGSRPLDRARSPARRAAQIADPGSRTTALEDDNSSPIPSYPDPQIPDPQIPDPQLTIRGSRSSSEYLVKLERVPGQLIEARGSRPTDHATRAGSQYDRARSTAHGPRGPRQPRGGRSIEAEAGRQRSSELVIEAELKSRAINTERPPAAHAPPDRPKENGPRWGRFQSSTGSRID